ncbi:cysteine-rich receptor-like protein kinase 2 [Rutidosis leptorrhynchoides]|uniref:cysteine-rich receptor-like protein kinase 2 n=1 Tax=Rutidosis leptorrhynchoides TaxID=125765 RepID=UPI003A98FF30
MMMSESSLKATIFVSLIIILQLVSTTELHARAQIIKITCDQKEQNNVTEFNQNFVNMTDLLAAQMQNSSIGTASIGTGPDSNFGLAQCYGDLSTEDCILCYTEARKVVPHCYPSNGGRIYLDGCFTRFQTYNFFEEYTGPDDTYVCGNETRKSMAFQDTVKLAMSNAVTNALRNKEYFGKDQMLVSGNGNWNGNVNEFVYVLANCWGTLSPSSCSACLANATASVSKCLPWSEGRALNTGCFLRYSDTNFHNPVLDTGRAINKKVNWKTIVLCVLGAVGSVVFVTSCGFAIRWFEKRNYL